MYVCVCVCVCVCARARTHTHTHIHTPARDTRSGDGAAVEHVFRRITRIAFAALGGPRPRGRHSIGVTADTASAASVAILASGAQVARGVEQRP